MSRKNKKMTAEIIDGYQRWLSRNDHFGFSEESYDEKSMQLIDELFLLLDQIAPVHENGAVSLWLHANRGNVEDFGSVGEGYDFETEEERLDCWLGEYPDEVSWFAFDAVEVKEDGYRAVMLRHKFVISQSNHRKKNAFPINIAPFVKWLVDSVQECVDMLKAGTYNDFINENLPPIHRTGTIRRKDFWDVWPEHRAEFFKDISKDDVAEFCTLAYSQTDNEDDIGRMQSVTVNDFFRFCALGYAANNYEGCDKTPREQYYLHSDGRDDGLGDIDPDSSEAFDEWRKRKNKTGHPWEVCRGGNSTHISLYVHRDEKGAFLTLAGDAWNRTIETVKFYLALRRKGIPVFLAEAHTLADRLTEVELIGIVPDGVIPAYCESWFTGQHIIDYMNLPFEDTEKFLPFCKWQREKEVCLKENKQ